MIKKKNSYRQGASNINCGTVAFIFDVCLASLEALLRDTLVS